MPRAAKVSLIILVALACCFCVGSYALDRYLLGQTYARYVGNDLPFALADADIEADYPMQDVQFQMDGRTLRGHVYGAENEQGLVILRHGIFSQHQDYLAFVVALVDRGWKVFAYDAIGCGESDGDSVIGFAQSPLDVRAAVRFADESGMADGIPIMLLGHSWGGYGVAGALGFADVGERVSACVSMSGFDAPTDIIMESAEASMGPAAAMQRPFVELIGRLDFGDDADRSGSRSILESGVPTLVVHGTEDEVVSYDNASIMSRLANSNGANVALLSEPEPGRNGHNTYFYSPESSAYLAECAERLESLKAQYDGNVPEDALDDFMATIDKRRANTADPALIDEIDAFFRKALMLTRASPAQMLPRQTA